MKIKLRNVFTDIISGEWGEEDFDGSGVFIIRTANFVNDGNINYKHVVNRRIVKKIFNENKGEEWVIDEQKIEIKKLRNEDIIIEKSGGGVGTPVGRVVYFVAPDNKIYLSNNFTYALRVDKRIAYPKYIFYLLRYLYKKGTVLKYQNQTTGIFNLKIERYFEEEIILPTLDIQYSSAAQLDAIQELINGRMESIRVLNNLVNSYYNELFGNPISNPNNWNKKKLLEVGSWKSGGTPDTTNVEYYEGRIPWFTSGELGDTYIQNSIKYISDDALKNSNAKLIPQNSILIGMYDTAAFKISINKVECSCNQAISYSQLFDQHYTLFVYFTLLLSKKHYLSKRKGARQKNLNSSFIKNIEIIYPTSKKDKDLIERFYSFLEVYEKEKEYLSKSFDLLQTFYQAVLQNIFNKGVDIDEEPIFKELIKKFSLRDLRGNKIRLKHLISMFYEKKFEDLENYSNAREKLFELISEKEILQTIKNDEIVLQVP